MTIGPRMIGTAAGALLAVLSTSRAAAQGAPPPPPRVASRPAVTAAPATTTPAPVLVPASAPTPAPPAPQKIVTPASALPPSDSAVALCGNGTFVNTPGTPADCASRGGLRVAFTSHFRTPPPAPGTPAATAAAAQRSAPSRTISADVTHPTGATARCKDATYITGATTPTMCDGHGGVAAIFPAANAVPTAPARRP